jgi:hypothetical protein
MEVEIHTKYGILGSLWKQILMRDHTKYVVEYASRYTSMFFCLLLTIILT